MKSFVIGVCGGSGSGKTTLVNNLLNNLGEENACLIAMDSFYKYQPDTTYEQRCKTNYDHPSAFDIDLLCDCIEMLKDGKDAQIPIYDYTIHNRSDKPWEVVKAKKIIIVDGILLFAFPSLLKLMDLKIYVDTPADVRILRRLARDVNERARSVDSVIDQYLTTVKPMHDTYIEPNKRFADIIVPDGGKNVAAYELIIDALRKRL